MKLARALSIPLGMLVMLLSVTASFGQSSAYNGQSTTAPTSAPLKQSPAFSTQNALVALAGSTCTGAETVLLIQDVVPWAAGAGQDPRGADFTELLAQQRNFCAVTSDQLANTVLSGFKQIVIASAQTQHFYDTLFPNHVIDQRIAAWVQAGGFLIGHLADSASGPGNGGNWNTYSFIGNVQHSGISGASNDDNILDSSNSLIADNLSCPGNNCGVVIDHGQYTDLDGWGLSDHGYFTNLPEGTITILAQGPNGAVQGSPVTIQYSYGSGTVLATLTTIEFRYVGGFGGIPQNKKLLANEFVYPNVTTTQTGSTITSDTLSQSFVFDPIEGQRIEFDFDYTTASNSNTLTIPENTVPTVTNNGITQNQYTQMVQGTALATTSCFLANGQKDANGNSLCTTLTLECTNANNPTPAGDNCPQSTARNLLFKHIFDTSAVVTAPPPGFAFTLAMGSDIWQPGSCVLTGLETNQLCPRSLLTQLFVIGDPTTKSGGTGKTSNSTFIFGCCEPEWHTTPTIALWNRTTTVPVSFQSNPPPANPTNGYRAAQGQSVTFGFESPGATPDPTFPVANDQTLMNSTACPTSPDWSQQHAAPFNTRGNITVPGEGPWELHFFSTDCDDMQELQFTKPASDTQNWASFKTALFNVDLTPPVVTNLVLNPPPVNGTYQLGQVVTATLTCTDPVSNLVASGIAKCGSANTNGSTTVTVTNVLVPTGTPGPQTFGATDVAGNSTVALSYNVVAADLDVIEFGPLQVKPRSTATYVVGAWNSGPNSASNVVVSGVVPNGETLVSASFAPVTLTLTSVSAPPSGTPCLVSGNTFSCSVGTLAPIPAGSRSFTGIGVKVVTTVNATVRAGTLLKNTAAVRSDTADTDKDTSFTWFTWVTSN